MSSGNDALPSINTPMATATSSSSPYSPDTGRSSTGTDGSEHHTRKWASLLFLILFTTATSVVSQRSRAGSPQERYSIATSVFLSELLKLCVGFALSVFAADGNSSRDTAALPLFSEKTRQLEDDPGHVEQLDTQNSPLARSQTLSRRLKKAYKDIYAPSVWMMGVPALVYVCQNMLQLMANSYLSSVAYQGLSQLKLITAAVISVGLFGKKLSIRQWMCLPVLLVGVVFLSQRISPSKQDIADAVAILHEPSADSPFSHRLEDGQQASTPPKMAQALQLAWQYSSTQMAIGATCVVLACVCGSFAGVYVESKLKASMSVSLSVRNAQLASFSMLTAGAAVVMEAISHGEWRPFANFSMLAWTTVLLRGASGYVVSATLRYADTILKGFATSVAIITTIALESVLSSRAPSLQQVLGSTLVMISTYNYVRFGAVSKS